MRRSSRATQPAKRRTTLTLPTKSLTEAQRIATNRNVNLSTVISEALAEGLRVQARAERAESVLKSYQRAFYGFSEDEMALLNGIVLEPVEGQ
jgi:hypothetical protein